MLRKEIGGRPVTIQIMNLNPCYDHWVIISNPPKTPNVLRGDSIVKLVDGKGLNIARVFRTLGFEDYVCLNILGGDVGKIISSKCREENLKTVEFWIEDENRINTAVVYEYEKKMVMINEPGPFIKKREIEEFISFITFSLIPESTVVISGSAPRGFGTKDMSKVAQLIKEKSCRLMVDISGEWLKELVKYEPEMVKVNAEELKIAFELEDISLTQLNKLRKTFNIEVLCITKGKEGSTILSEEAIFHVKPKIVYSDFSVGSGDSFFAGYLYSFGKITQRKVYFCDSMRHGQYSKIWSCYFQYRRPGESTSIS